MKILPMEQIRIRRCWHLLCEPLQALQLDMAALLSGDGRPLLAVSHQWSALAAHLDGPVVLDDAQLALLGRLDREQWVPLAQLPDAAQRLLDTGLALAHNDQRQCACRDQQLRQAHWWGPAAVLHAQARWQGQDSVQQLAARGMDRLDGLIGELGIPPASGRDGEGALPLPPVADSPLEQLLGRRVSCRNFDGGQMLALDQVSAVLWAALAERSAVIHDSGARFSKKGTPSAGGLHPTEAYLLLRNVQGIKDGCYHYQASAHQLLPLAVGADADVGNRRDWSALATRWLAGQYWFADAQVLVVLAPRYDRLQWKYRNHSKAYRAAVLDVGHLSQTLYLAATEAGLGAFVTAAINELDVERDLGLQPFGDGPLAIAGFGIRAAQMTTAELDPAGAVWQPAPEGSGAG